MAPKESSEKPPSPISFGTKQDRGSVFQPVHLKRRVKIYPILEQELLTISVLNTGVIACWSVAGLAAGVLLSTLWDMSIGEDQTRQTGYIWIGFCLAAIGISLGIAKWISKKRKNMLETIQNEVV